jgi:single-strand DNA-binding protein
MLAIMEEMSCDMSQKKVIKKTAAVAVEEEDFSLNDLLLRGRISAEALEKELPSGDKVVEFRLIVSRERRDGVDTLDIGAWSAKSRRMALSLKPDEWVEVSGAVHRRFWTGAGGLASRWQVEAVEISRI